MPKIKYVNKAFNDSSLLLIAQATTIIKEYQQDKLNLTVRQLYYQFVQRNWIKNDQKQYNRLSRIISSARLAGLVDWNMIIDRTRSPHLPFFYEDPHDALDGLPQIYQLDKWQNQPYRLEVWIEKDALVGVIANICQTNQIAYFSMRGFTSQSSLWSAANRIKRYEKLGQSVIILHFGDHDPSGIDMTRDIENRLTLFLGAPFLIYRVALNKEQLEKYNPPPNPTKFKDPRAADYIRNFGIDSWELDALNPKTIVSLIKEKIDEARDITLWNEILEIEQDHQNQLETFIATWRDK